MVNRCRSDSDDYEPLGRERGSRGGGQPTCNTATVSNIDHALDQLRKENEILKAKVTTLTKDKKDLQTQVKTLNEKLNDTQKIKSRKSYKITNEQDMLSAGLLYAGFDSKRQESVNLGTNIERFKAFYQLPPKTLLAYFTDVRSKFPNVSHRDLLMTFNWFTLYEPLPVLSGRWGYCEPHIGTRTQECCAMMQTLKESKIRFEFDDNGRIFLASHDTVSFTTQEFRLNPNR